MNYLRTQIYLEPEQHRDLLREAHAEGVSLAELIRRIVRRHIEQKPESRAHRRGLRSFVGLGTSGLEDVSERHDAYLGNSFHDDTAG